MLIFAVRDTAKGENAAKKLQEELPTWNGKAEVWKLDMASFASVKAFGERINTLSRLDILIANAGVSSGTINSAPKFMLKNVVHCHPSSAK